MSAKSQTFDFGRFAMTLRRDLTLGRRQYAIRILAMLGILTVVMLLVGTMVHNVMTRYHEAPYDNLEVLFTFAAIIFCSLGASTFSNDMITPGTRLNALMLPASTLEKYITRFLICVIGTFAAYLVCFMIADIIRVIAINAYYGDDNAKLYLTSDVFKDTVLNLGTMTTLLSAQATFVLGSALWPKNSFIKTFAASWAFQTVILIVFAITLKIAIADKAFHMSAGVGEMKYSALYLIEAANTTWALFCFITAYFRMRESEIINRF